MNKDKIIKDLKERNDKLKNQYQLQEIRLHSLEYENKKLHKELDYADNYNIYLIAKLDKIKEIFEVFKENGKEYYEYYEFYNISGEKVIKILELLEEIE